MITHNNTKIPVAISGPPTGTWYYHHDQIDSTAIISDGRGKLATNITYLPFGEVDPDHSVYYKLDSDTGSEVVPVTHLFTGQEYDPAAQMMYYGARYYEPAIGRFITADTVVPELRNTQAYNRYAYVINNPLKYTDPTGHYWWDKTVGNAISGGIGNNTNNYDFKQGASKGFWHGYMLRNSTSTYRLYYGAFRPIFIKRPEVFIRGATWEYLQNQFAFSLALVLIWSGQVDSVDYYNEATVVKLKYSRHKDNLRFTMGNTMFVNKDSDEKIYKHEYGHVKQSHWSGPYYLYVAVLSFSSLLIDRLGNRSKYISHDHENYHTERGADQCSENSEDFWGCFWRQDKKKEEDRWNKN